MPDSTVAAIHRAFAAANAEKPAYRELYPLMEAMFTAQAQQKETLRLPLPELPQPLVASKWQEGFPLIQRWDFPLDANAARELLDRAGPFAPAANQPLRDAHAAIMDALRAHPEMELEIWQSFLHHEWEPWDEWVRIQAIDPASLLFWARSCLRPQLEWSAERLLAAHPLPASWLKGYCPVCGSLPGILHLDGSGERKAHCSWCGSQWHLYRLQCPYCDNRAHESLGYLALEQEPHYRVQYCRLCRYYFKLIDLRERLDPVWFPLEEWTTLHLDLLARKEGWQTPPSPSPVVYGTQTDTSAGKREMDA